MAFAFALMPIRLVPEAGSLAQEQCGLEDLRDGPTLQARRAEEEGGEHPSHHRWDGNRVYGELDRREKRNKERKPRLISLGPHVPRPFTPAEEIRKDHRGRATYSGAGRFNMRCIGRSEVAAKLPLLTADLIHR